MTLTKAELADLLFEKVGLNKREAKDMVERFFEEIRGALENGDSVKLSSRNFQLRDKPSGGPQSAGEKSHHRPPRRDFHASQKLSGRETSSSTNGNVRRKDILRRSQTLFHDWRGQL